MTSNDQFSHDVLRESLAECALGVLDGRQRAAVMAHVETCEECESELRALSATSEALVTVPVAQDPPLGFESRVMDRIRYSDAPVALRRWRPLQLAAAAAVLVAAIGVGWTLDHATSTPVTKNALRSNIVERSLVSNGRTIGAVYVDTARPSWMFVSIDAPGAPSRIRCEVITNSGRHDLVGTFWLSGGYGAWGKTLDVPWSAVRTVEISTTSGVRIATLQA
ncbi:MAG TPA: hypothetical protein VND83_03635 [Acidimicrobiales bacterium]|nr:hypothetical protein [Acidimicrobiales bacterium]